MTDDLLPQGHEGLVVIFKDATGSWKIVSADEPLPVSSSGGGTPQVQVIAAALQNPGTESTTPLVANDTATGAWQWNSFTQSRFTVAAGADQNGHLYLECSPDEGATVYAVADAAVPADGWAQLTTIMVGWPMMYRARFVNGDNPQGHFVLAHNLTFS